MIAINTAEQIPTVEQIVDELNLTMPVGLGTWANYHQFGRDELGFTPFPLDFIIDQEGIIRYKQTAYDPQLMQDVINNLLELDVEEHPDRSMKEIPAQYEIFPVFPNPFNSNAIISIGLPEVGDLNVSAFNILGKQVSVLANGQYNVGYHNLVFDGSGLSSGIYFIRANVPGKMNEIRKVVLMK